MTQPGKDAFHTIGGKMAIIWMDNWDWIAAGTTPSSSPTLDTLHGEKYPTSTLSGSDADVLSTPGPGQTLKFSDTTTELFYIDLPTTHSRGDEMFGSMRMRIFQSASSNPFLSFYSTTGNESIAVHLDDLGVFRVDRLGSTEVARFHVPQLNPGEWVTLEWKLVNGNASDTPNNGAFALKINGVTYVDEDPLDTYNFGTGINEIRIRNLGNGGDRGYEVRDLIICDDSGSICNTWIGQQKHVYGLLPNANGSNTAWTRSTGTDDFALIDEVSRDSTDYIESSTSSQKTTVNMEATGSETNILGVMVQTNAFLDSAGSENMQHVVRHSGSEGNSGNLTVDSTTEEVKVSFHETNPSTSSAWTAAEVDAMEAGVEYQ